MSHRCSATWVQSEAGRATEASLKRASQLLKMERKTGCRTRDPHLGNVFDFVCRILSDLLLPVHRTVSWLCLNSTLL